MVEPHPPASAAFINAIDANPSPFPPRGTGLANRILLKTKPVFPGEERGELNPPTQPDQSAC